MGMGRLYMNLRGGRLKVGRDDECWMQCGWFPFFEMPFRYRSSAVIMGKC